MYKESRTFVQRVEESGKMRQRYPERIPEIIEPKTNAPPIDKRKYMVPKELTCGQLLYVIRNRLKMSPEEALFLYLPSATIPASSAVMGDLHGKHKDEDGFLYMKYACENTFG